MIKSDILFTGYYGQLNTGDDAFVEVASWGANKFWDKKNIRFLAVKQRLPKVKTNINGYPFRIPKSYNIQQNILLNNSEYLISAGGSTFQNFVSPNSLKSKAMRLVEQNKLKIGAIGVSIGPYKNIADEKSNIEYLKKMSFLSVRDQRSYDYVKSLDLPYDPINSFDLAALLPDIYGITKNKINSKNKTIGISLCNYERYINGDLKNESRRNLEVTNLLKRIDNELNINFKFFIINGNLAKGDKELTYETIKKINFKNKVEIEEYNHSTEQVWNQISCCDFVITTRLHAGIFACFSDTPFMMIEYHKKCTDFLNDVNQHNDYRLNDADFDQDNIVDSIINTLNQSNIILPSLKIKMKEKALLNFKEINL